MKKKLTATILIALLSFCTGIAFGQSVMKVPVESYDFGYAPQNANISHRFWLYSNGTDTLKITSVKPGCGCTKAPLEKSIVAPGDSTMVELIFNTKKYSGKMSKSATIITNALQATNQVSFSTSVMNDKDTTLPATFTPEIVTVHRVADKAPDKFVLSIQNSSAGDITPVLDGCPRDLFDVKLPKKIKAGKTAEAEIKINKMVPAFEKSFTIQLDDAKASRFTIPVVYSDSLDSAMHTSK
jgi:hypothetical protein